MATRLALLLLVSACAWAQLKVDIHPVVGRASDRLKEAQRELRVAQQLPLRAPNAPEELAVLEAVEKGYHQNFQPEIGSDPRVAVATEKGNDILVAKWIAPSPSPFSELIVWDAPDSTSFIFKLPVGSWSRDSVIRSTFESLLSSAESGGIRLGPQAVYLDVARDAQTQHWIGAGGLLIPHAPLQFDVGPLNWVDLWGTGTASYLCAKFSGYLGYGIPWHLRYIPERFPPLEARAKQWTTQQILDELDCQPARAARGGINAWIGGYERRDRVLAKELMKRDVRQEELLAVLLNRRPYENGALLYSVVEAGQTARFASAIRDYLKSDSGVGMGVIPNYTSAFDTVGRTLDANFTDAALEVLRHANGPANGAFSYAARHGETRADYLALKELIGKSRLSPNLALEDMRKRLALDEDGNPIAAK